MRALAGTRDFHRVADFFPSPHVYAYEACRATVGSLLLQPWQGDTTDVFHLPSQTFPEVIRVRAERIGACEGEGVRATGQRNVSELECPYSEERTGDPTSGAKTAMPRVL